MDASEKAARLLTAARLEGRKIGALPADCRPADEAAAYSAQAAAHDLLTAAGKGARIGWKIGCTTPVMQRFLDIHNPCAGGMFERSRYRGHADLRHADFIKGAVECEIEGMRVRTLCNEDLLLVLCVHAAKHCWSQLGMVRDIAALARFDLDWRWVTSEARRLGIARIISVSLELARLLLKLELPQEVASYPTALDAIKPSIWPRVMTAIGSVLLFAALLTLMFLGCQLALSAIAV